MVDKFSFNAGKALVAEIRNHVEANGGFPLYFDNIEKNPVGVMTGFGSDDFDTRQLLNRLLSEKGFADLFLNSFVDEKDKAYITEYLSSWSLFRELYPSDFAWVVVALDRRKLWRALEVGIPHYANDVVGAVANIYLDSKSEDLQVNCAIRLKEAKKDLGEKTYLLCPAAYLVSSHQYISCWTHFHSEIVKRLLCAFPGYKVR